MKTSQLKNKLLISAILLSMLLAAAYTLAVSWVIRQQYLDESRAFLQKSTQLILDDLGERKARLLLASHQLANQNNLGPTIWYLSQYSETGVDTSTLTDTYKQLARDTYKAGKAAGISSVAIYNATGNLVSFARIGEQADHFGFVRLLPQPRLLEAIVKPGGNAATASLQPSQVLEKSAYQLGRSLPVHEGVHFVEQEGHLALQSEVPVNGMLFDEKTGAQVLRQLGLIVMVRLLDQPLVEQMHHRTDTDINIFTSKGLSAGSITSYRQQDWMGLKPGELDRNAPQAIGEIEVDGSGYYQSITPVYEGTQLIGSIATLRTRQIAQNNTLQMMRIVLLIAGASLLFMVPFAWYFATSISRPLTTLIGIFRRVARNPDDAAVREELHKLRQQHWGHGEMEDLTQSFIAMNDAITEKINQIVEINASLERIVGERTAALAAREAESRTLIENSPDTIARYDSECRRIFVNQAFATLSNGSVSDLLGKTPAQVPGGANAEIYEAQIREVFRTGEKSQFELKWLDANGREVCSHIRLTPEIDANGQVISVLGVGRDITERIEFETMIWRQANFDVLTGLPNRQRFYDRLGHEALVCHRNHQHMALMLIDLDHFKEVNDTLGHDQGDILLVEAARRIKGCVRETDTVARLGGDEFTVILSGIGTDLTGVERTARAILARLLEPFVLGSEEAFISASIGITFYPNDATDLEALFKHADQAMYAAKNAGRNRYSYFTADMHEAAQRRLRLTSDLRTGVVAGQFRLFYQPVIELASGQVVKAEALLRWQHPVLGLIEPDQFIGLAEESGLIIPIGDWVFQQVLEEARRWREYLRPDFQICVNKSPAQIRHHEKNRQTWLQHLQERGMPGDSICIEITEGLLLNAESGIEHKLLAYREAGIELAIDDFGTGYSSLTYLKKFDIDYLKIDRAFVNHLETDADDQALCSAIIAMAHKLGVKVVAEGVESAWQRDFLCRAGCDLAQGFFFARPMASTDFEAQWLARDANTA